MPESTLPVEHLFTLTAATTEPVVIKDGPQGTRTIVAVSGGTFEGEKLNGKIAASPGGDWLTMRADGTFKLDVRLTLLTDDGAAILMSYTGFGTRENGIRSAPSFETGDERYAWLNAVQGVGVGTPGRGTVTYDVYRVL